MVTVTVGMPVDWALQVTTGGRAPAAPPALTSSDAPTLCHTHAHIRMHTWMRAERKAEGLPGSGTLVANFNQLYKTTPDVFAA